MSRTKLTYQLTTSETVKRNTLTDKIFVSRQYDDYGRITKETEPLGLGRFLFLSFVWITFFVFHVSAQIPPGYYNPGDIAVINSMIENNSLEFTKADPADGSYIPDDWTGIGWSWQTDITNYRIQSLYIPGPLRINNQELVERALTGDLDLTGLTRLQWLDCNNNRLNSLNVSELSELTTIKCDGNSLTSLDIAGMYNLQTLDCSGNKLETLDVSGLTNLQTLSCSSNNLTSLDVSGLTNLQILNCSSNQMVSLNVSGLTELITLNIAHNSLTSLEIADLKSLASLECPYNYLESLDLSGLNNLSQLLCFDNRLTSLIVSGLTGLFTIVCDNNYLTTIDVSGLSRLGLLQCTNNCLTSINVSGIDHIFTLNANSQQCTLALTGIPGNYTANVTFNSGTTFGNASLSYDNGMLTSISDTALTSIFSAPIDFTNRTLSGNLTLTYYNTQADIDMEAVAATKEAIENYTYTVKQDTANTKEEVENRLIVTFNDMFDDAFFIHYGISGTSIVKEVTILAISPAVEGTNTNPAGNNGSFIFYVTLTCGEISLTTDEITGIIEATPYTEKQVKQIALLALEDLKFRILNTGNIPTGDLILTLSGDNADAFTLPYPELSSLETGSETELEIIPQNDLAERTYKAILTVSGEGLSAVSIEISFTVINSGNKNQQTIMLTACIQNGTLRVCGLAAGKPWYVYNMSGSIIYYSIANSHEASINVSVPGIYIVKSGANAVKAF